MERVCWWMGAWLSVCSDAPRVLSMSPPRRLNSLGMPINDVYVGTAVQQDARGGEDSGALKLTLGIADLLDLTSRPSKVSIVAAPNVLIHSLETWLAV
jgi:hypothetical protein